MKRHFEDLKESCVSEIERNSAIYGQIFDFVHITHFNDQVVHCSQSYPEMFFGERLKFDQILNETLKLGMIKPGHLYDFGKKSYDHFQDTLVALGSSHDQMVKQVVFDPHFFLHWNLAPIRDKQLFEA